MPLWRKVKSSKSQAVGEKVNQTCCNHVVYCLYLFFPDTVRFFMQGIQALSANFASLLSGMLGLSSLAALSLKGMCSHCCYSPREVLRVLYTAVTELSWDVLGLMLQLPCF